MEPSKAIINLGDFAKPANTLVEKISDAIGGIFKPYQIRKVAQAEAEVDKIRALSKIEISEIEHRALQRLVTEEAKKQSNIESITSQALPKVTEAAKPENMEDDWITNFFDKCRLISDKEMQSLWAKVLAGEANSPSKYSKRTVNFLSTLDKPDAELFCKLCSFVFTRGKEPLVLVYDRNHAIYKDQGITFPTLTHLDSIGLIKCDFFGTYVIQKLGHIETFAYHNRILVVEFPKTDNNDWNIGQVVLTKIGDELAPICGSSPIDGFVEYTKEKWQGFGYKIISDVKQSTQT